jgi:hypothetical protein
MIIKNKGSILFHFQTKRRAPFPPHTNTETCFPQVNKGLAESAWLVPRTRPTTYCKEKKTTDFGAHGHGKETNQ